MHCGKKELCYLAQTLCLLGESNLEVIENSFNVSAKNVSNTEPPHPLLYE